MNSKYEFKRNFYYDVKKSVEDNRVTFVLGPRITGKTVCLKQLADELPNSGYYNAKMMSGDETVDLIDEIVFCIQHNENRAFLVDETTYLLLPEKMLAKTANACADCKNTNTKVVFTGSPSSALRAWAVRAFAGNAKYIFTDFLSCPEWLKFKGLSETSALAYNQFIFGLREFYSDFVSIDAYLESCLDIVSLSNFKTSNIIFNNECDKLTVPILKDILYSAATHTYREMPFDVMKQGYIFLQRNGLVTLTHISDETKDFENIIDVMADLCRRNNSKITNSADLANMVNISVKHPMFFAEIAKEKELKGDILGGAVECHARGILSQECSYVYHRDKQTVDYVNFAERKAVNFSERNSFEHLPQDFKKTVLTKDTAGSKNGVEYIPYYKFFY